MSPSPSSPTPKTDRLDGWGHWKRWATAGGSTNDVIMIRSEMHDLIWASTEGPSCWKIAPYSPSGPHLPGGSLS